MSFSNVYYKRTAGTAKACYICLKPTTTVLATMNTVDFLYTCQIHLTDHGFATLISNGGEKTVVSQEEIAKVKAEWEEKQKQKLAKDKEKELEKEKDKDKDKDKDKESGKGSDKKESKKEDSKSPKPPGSFTTSPSPSPSSSTPTHERYALHRNVFTMRQDAHKKRRQASQAKELAPRLPGAPQGGL